MGAAYLYLLLSWRAAAGPSSAPRHSWGSHELLVQKCFYEEGASSGGWGGETTGVQMIRENKGPAPSPRISHLVLQASLPGTTAPRCPCARLKTDSLAAALVQPQPHQVHQAPPTHCLGYQLLTVLWRGPGFRGRSDGSDSDVPQS